MRKVLPIVFVLVLGGVAYFGWIAYEDYELARRAGPLRQFIRAEQMRFASKETGTGFEPRTCDKSCSQEFLERYAADKDGVLLFYLGGHPLLAGKTLRYVPTVPAGASAAGPSPPLWRCQTNVTYPAAGLFPDCD